MGFIPWCPLPLHCTDHNHNVSHPHCHPLVPQRQKFCELNSSHTLAAQSYIGHRAVWQVYSATGKSAFHAGAPLVPTNTMKSRQTWGWGVGGCLEVGLGCELRVLRVGAGWDADRGQVTVHKPQQYAVQTPPDRREVGNQKTATHSIGSQFQSHTHAHLPPLFVSTQSARKPTYPQGYGFYHSCPPRGLV